MKPTTLILSLLVSVSPLCAQHRVDLVRQVALGDRSTNISNIQGNVYVTNIYVFCVVADAEEFSNCKKEIEDLVAPSSGSADQILIADEPTSAANFIAAVYNGPINSQLGLSGSNSIGSSERGLSSFASSSNNYAFAIAGMDSTTTNYELFTSTTTGTDITATSPAWLASTQAGLVNLSSSSNNYAFTVGGTDSTATNHVLFISTPTGTDITATSPAWLASTQAGLVNLSSSSNNYAFTVGGTDSSAANHVLFTSTPTGTDIAATSPPWFASTQAGLVNLSLSPSDYGSTLKAIGITGLPSATQLTTQPMSVGFGTLPRNCVLTIRDRSSQENADTVPVHIDCDSTREPE